MDLLHANGIAVDLATATASPPPWLAAEHPEILPVTAERRNPLAGRPAALAAHLAGLPRARAERWCAPWPNGTRTTPRSAPGTSPTSSAATTSTTTPTTPRAAFRGWLQDRYGTLDELNNAWGTDVLVPALRDWDQILPPRKAASLPEPHAAAGLQALLLGRAAGLPARRTRHPATASPRTSPSPPTSW